MANTKEGEAIDSTRFQQVMATVQGIEEIWSIYRHNFCNDLVLLAQIVELFPNIVVIMHKCSPV